MTKIAFRSFPDFSHPHGNMEENIIEVPTVCSDRFEENMKAIFKVEKSRMTVSKGELSLFILSG